MVAETEAPTAPEGWRIPLQPGAGSGRCQDGVERDLDREELGGGLLVKVPMGAIVALLGCGAVLAVLPWLALPEPMRAPARIEPGSSAFVELTALCREVDRACRDGDVARLRRLITPEMWRSSTRLLRAARRRADGRSLAQQRALVGDLDALQPVCGAAANERAVLVFLRARPVAAGGAVRRSLLALGFVWDGYRFLLDAKTSVRTGATGSVRKAAEHLALRLLTEP